MGSESNFKYIGIDDKISSFRIYAGEGYEPGWVCDFYQHANYSGGMLQGGGFGPNSDVSNIAIAPYSFNDAISSVKVYKA